MSVEIKSGEIRVGGVNVGTARKELKYGYHPAVLVEVGKNSKWFELDEKDLLAKIAEFATDHR